MSLHTPMSNATISHFFLVFIEKSFLIITAEVFKYRLLLIHATVEETEHIGSLQSE